MPWIHVADMARLYLHAADTEGIRGPMNAVAPNPVRNSEFTKALGRALHRPAFMPAPYLGLRLVFGEFAKVLFAFHHANMDKVREYGVRVVDVLPSSQWLVRGPRAGV
jgi:NAD dependent epimerase/dehydratase family enzyme